MGEVCWYTNQAVHFIGDLQCDVCILSSSKTKWSQHVHCKPIKVRPTCVQIETIFTSQTRGVQYVKFTHVPTFSTFCYKFTVHQQNQDCIMTDYTESPDHQTYQLVELPIPHLLLGPSHQALRHQDQVQILAHHQANRLVSNCHAIAKCFSIMMKNYDSSWW